MVEGHIYLSIYLSMNESIDLCISVYPSIYLSIYMYVHCVIVVLGGEAVHDLDEPVCRVEHLQHYLPVRLTFIFAYNYTW